MVTLTAHAHITSHSLSLIQGRDALLTARLLAGRPVAADAPPASVSARRPRGLDDATLLRIHASPPLDGQRLALGNRGGASGGGAGGALLRSSLLGSAHTEDVQPVDLNAGARLFGGAR